MLDRLAKFFLAYDAIATIILATGVAIGLCFIAYRWFVAFYLASAWIPLAAAGFGMLAIIAFVSWAIYYRQLIPLLVLFLLVVFMAVPIFTTAEIDGFLP